MSSILESRYASSHMVYMWSEEKKFTIWRDLWFALAEFERKAGLPITPEQVAELKANINTVDVKRASEIEAEVHHDVMSHVLALGEQCPIAKPIIHLGVTSCFVTDNADAIRMRDSALFLKSKMSEFGSVMSNLREFALKYRDLPTLGLTHLQPAQLTTVGKRAALWHQDFYFDYENLTQVIKKIPFRGVKGTTGTQASFLELTGGDEKKVKEIDMAIAKCFGFENKCLALTGQTLSRKIDFFVVSALVGIAQSAKKMATDIRLLASRKEIEEPFEEKQIGSSAMPYKRNPMLCERICGLSRSLIELIGNTANTAAEQWMERTLDDSANRRLTLPTAFMLADAILDLCAKVTRGLVVYPKVIKRNVMAELPFMATENILMAAVKAGGDRQELHEIIRQLSIEASDHIKKEGSTNQLLDMIRAEPAFAAVRDKINEIADPQKFVGRAPEQVFEAMTQSAYVKNF